MLGKTEGKSRRREAEEEMVRYHHHLNAWTGIKSGGRWRTCKPGVLLCMGVQSQTRPRKLNNSDNLGQKYRRSELGISRWEGSQAVMKTLARNVLPLETWGLLPSTLTWLAELTASICRAHSSPHLLPGQLGHLAHFKPQVRIAEPSLPSQNLCAVIRGRDSPS